MEVILDLVADAVAVEVSRASNLILVVRCSRTDGGEI